MARIDKKFVPLIKKTQSNRAVVLRSYALSHYSKLENIINSTLDAIFCISAEGVITFWNQGAVLLFGFSRREALGKQIDILIPADNKSEANYFHLDVLKNNGVICFETTRLRKDSEIIDVELTMSPLKVSSKKSKEIIAIARDISVKKKYEKDILEERDRAELYFNAAAVILLVLDSHGYITKINKAGAKLLGASVEDLIGLPWVDNFIPESNRGEIRELFFKIVHESKNVTSFFENYIIDTKNHLKLISWSNTLLRDKNGDVYSIISSGQDITEQRNIERQKEEFLGLVSHELKTPVTSIKAFNQVIQRFVNDTGNVSTYEMLRKMENQINKLTSLINDLLDTTRIQAGKLQFNEVLFNFDELVREIIEQLSFSSDRHDLVAQLDCDLAILGDRDRIGQVIINLITNAIKYSPFNDKIIISTRIDKDFLLLSVQDFGIGIPKKGLKRIFDRFYRAHDSTKFTFSGLGLGLYISNEIVNRQGGKMWVESTLHKGSTFFVHLPIRKPSK